MTLWSCSLAPAAWSPVSPSSRDNPWDPLPERRLGIRDADNFSITFPIADLLSGCCCG